MATYTQESADIPSEISIRPVYDGSQGITAVECGITWKRRIKNDADSSDLVERVVSSKLVDLLDATKSVSIAGLGSVKYSQIAQLLKKVADAERG